MLTKMIFRNMHTEREHMPNLTRRSMIGIVQHRDCSTNLKRDLAENNQEQFSS